MTGFQNFLKDSLTIVKATSKSKYRSDNSNGDPMPWGLLVFFIGMAVLTAFGGLLLLTACMKRYDATYSSAMFVGSFVITASIMSAVHYDTFEHLDGAVNSICYPAGLAILMAGVYMLIAEKSRIIPVENDEDEEEEYAESIVRSPSQISLVQVRGKIKHCSCSRTMFSNCTVC